MQKLSQNEFPIVENIRKRWSPRAFAKSTITEQELNNIFEAARWAPSAANEQPWQFIYAHNGTEGFQTILNCLLPGNTPWAQNASVLAISVARRTFAANQRPNDYSKHDLGMATANLLHQAISVGIYCHVMGRFDKTKAVQSLGLSEDQEPVCAIALGHLGDVEDLDEPYKSRELGERTRKPINEFTKKL